MSSKPDESLVMLQSGGATLLVRVIRTFRSPLDRDNPDVDAHTLETSVLTETGLAFSGVITPSCKPSGYRPPAHTAYLRRVAAALTGEGVTSGEHTYAWETSFGVDTTARLLVSKGVIVIMSVELKQVTNPWALSWQLLTRMYTESSRLANELGRATDEKRRLSDQLTGSKDLLERALASGETLERKLLRQASELMNRKKTVIATLKKELQAKETKIASMRDQLKMEHDEAERVKAASVVRELRARDSAESPSKDAISPPADHRKRNILGAGSTGPGAAGTKRPRAPEISAATGATGGGRKGRGALVIEDAADEDEAETDLDDASTQLSTDDEEAEPVAAAADRRKTTAALDAALRAAEASRAASGVQTMADSIGDDDDVDALLGLGRHAQKSEPTRSSKTASAPRRTASSASTASKKSDSTAGTSRHRKGSAAAPSAPVASHKPAAASRPAKPASSTTTTGSSACGHAAMQTADMEFDFS